MKKIELIELIQEEYNGGSLNPDIYKELHPLVLGQYISMALNVIFYQIFKQDQSGLDSYARWYRKLDVKEDSGIKYTELPVSLIQMPDGGTSVRDIVYTEDEVSAMFVHVKTSNVGRAMRGGGIARMGKTIFTVTDRIEYYGINPVVKQVNVLMIAPFADLDDNDEIAIPQGQDKILLDLVFDFIHKRVENDNVTDNK